MASDSQKAALCSYPSTEATKLGPDSWTRRFAQSFPGAARRPVPPIEERSIWEFYGCPAPPFDTQDESLITQVAVTKATLSLSSPKHHSPVSSSCHDGLCLDGEALPRLLSSRLDQSWHAQSTDGLLHFQFDRVLSLARGHGRLSQAVSDLLSKDNTNHERGHQSADPDMCPRPKSFRGAARRDAHDNPIIKESNMSAFNSAVASPLQVEVERANVSEALSCSASSTSDCAWINKNCSDRIVPSQVRMLALDGGDSRSQSGEWSQYGLHCIHNTRRTRVFNIIDEGAEDVDADVDIDIDTQDEKANLY